MTAKLLARFAAYAGLLFLLASAWPAAAQQQEKRIALVIGNAAYAESALPTTANDAGLIAQQLQAAGFDVSGARDLDGDSLRRAFRDFVEKARQAGPDTVAVVYFAGYGLQFEGENYVAPVDAQIPTAADVPIQAVRVSDLMRPLAQLPMKARIVILDAARENPFARQGQPLASGLALVEPDPGVLIAFNAAPGTVAPPEKSGAAYGAYAQALAEMIRQGGAPLKDVFDEVRLRVSDVTKGAEAPWDADRVEANFVFFERAANAPEPPPNAGLSALRDRPLQDLGAEKAYQAALERDTIPAYQDFLAAYPNDPEAKRVRAILAARREAITWRRTLENGAANAYWSYLRRYPKGPHAWECRRRLARLAAAEEPPPDFAPIEYDVPPPPPDELVFVDRPVLMFDDPDFDLPPPPPVFVLEPPPEYIVDLPPPPPPDDVFILPIPVYAPLPVWVDPPPYIAPPPVNIIFYNIHNAVIINHDTVVVKDRTGKPVSPLANAVAAGALPPNAALPQAGAPHRAGQPPGAPRAFVGAAALGVALPPSVATRAQQLKGTQTAAPGGGGAGAPGGKAGNVLPGQLTGPGHNLPGQPPGHALPGQPTAQPLPGQPGQLGQQREQLIQQQRQKQLQGQPSTAPPQGHALPGQPALRPLPGQPAQEREQTQQREKLESEQQRQRLQQQQREQSLQQERQRQMQQREQSLQQERQRQMQQQREQSLQQERQRQMQQQREQSLQQERQRQMQQQREQSLQQERQRQMQQQREQSLQQERQMQMQQQREQVMQQQRQQQMMQQREQMMQQQRQQQMMQHAAPAGPRACGKPGLPRC